MKTNQGFTIVELMVGVAILGIMITLAVPSLNEMLTKMRVDDEISQVHRLVSTARNTAINMEQPVTMCPLKANKCDISAWDEEISVFIDLNSNGQFENSVSVDIDNDGVNETLQETLIRVKGSVKEGDELDYRFTRLTYAATGQASFGRGTFTYCPKDKSDFNRGVVVSFRGRAYKTRDIDGDDKDELRSGGELSCD